MERIASLKRLAGGDLLPRLITGLLLLGVLVPVIYYGGILRTFLLFVIFFGATLEYFRASIPASKTVILALSLSSLVFPISLLLWSETYLLQFQLLALFFLACFAYFFIEMRSYEGDFSRVYFALTSGLIYPILPLTVLFWVDMHCDGLEILWIIVCVVATDTFAYFGGRLAGGGRPLALRISPNKSVAGSVIGVLSSGLVSVLYVSWLELSFPLLTVVVVGFLVGILAVLGDLFESLLKRSIGCKDMGSILPGHGGILDRIDAMMFAIPILLFL